MKQQPQPSNGKTNIFEQLCESLPDALLIVDKKGSIVQSNTLADAMFGYTEEELRSLSVEMLMPEQSRILHHEHRSAYSVKPSSRMMGSGMRLRARRKDGTEFPVDIALGPIQSGVETMILCSIRDVSERHRMDEHIRKFSLAIEQTADCVIITDREGIIQYVNDAFEKETGYTREEAIGKTPHILKSGKHEDKFFEVLWKTILSGNVFSAVLINKRKDGNIIYEHKTITPLKDEKGEITHFVSTAKNITEQKLIEESLQRSEERYRELFETTSEVIHVLTPDGRFLFVNRAWREALGYSEKEVENLLMEHIIHPDNTQHCDTVFRRVLMGEEIDRLETSFVTKDGKKMQLEGSIKCRFEAGVPQNITCFLQDVTKRKQIEEERFQFMTTLEKSLNEIYIFDAVSLKFEYVNDSARRNLGYSSEELSHLTPIDIKSEYTEATFHEAVRPLLDHTKQHLIFETIHRRADGSTYPVEVHLQLVEQSSRRVFLALIYDITERKEEQKKIQFLANALESATDAISITDIDGKFIYANNAFLRLYGYSKEEVLGKTVLLVLPSSFPQQMPKSIQQATLKGGWRGELINRRKDGTEFPISLGTSAMKDQLGNVLGLVGVAKDITERKRIEAKLRFNEELYRDLVENINDVYFVTDARGKLTYASPNMFIHTGYTQEEIIGKSYIRLIADEDRGRIVQHYITCTNNGTIDTSIEFRVRRKDGTSVWAEQSTRIVRDAEGKPIQYSNVVRDITGRKLAGTALKVSEASLKEAQRIARMGNWKLDLVQNILTWSDEIYRIFEIDPARFGASYEAFLDLVHPEDREMVNRVYTESVKNRTPYDVVHRLKFSDERIKFVHERCETFYNEQGLPISSHGTVQDVTERIKMEENQKVLQSQLIQAQKLESLGTLASGIAHDFNNILTMVIGHASLLDRKIGTDSGVHESLGVIQQAAQRGASLVRQLLTFARKTETSREAVNINSMVNEVAKFIGETFPKTVRLSIHPANKLPFILADSTQIHQVLMNFCVNARDAMPNGGILSISTNVIPGESIIHKFPGATNPEYIELCVCDTGTGMDEGTVRRIFEPFFTTKELGKGTGLGLSVVSGIVETHGGFIDVSSTVGKGTTFSVYLPVQKESGSTKLVEEVKKEIPGGTEIILVIEDEVILMNLLTGLLEAKGYTVLTAYDGEEGIQKYVAHYKNISVVLSDLGLPKQSGEGVVKSIMSFNPKANVVVASGYIDPFVKSELYKAGVRQFIQKPYAPNELLKTIRETIDSKK